MSFETPQDVLDWYERQPRTLNAEFISGIKWEDTARFPIDERFIPVLLYMRDVEALTDMYYEELRRTPTGKNRVISKFMERWSVEETTHGELLNRFLCEYGVPAEERWREIVRGSVSGIYKANTLLVTALTNLIGSKFSATHMAFGAIHEMTTAQGYRRLIELVDHPVLTSILTAVIREESVHTHFYWSVARLELEKSEAARKLARFVIDRFWNPVGQGSKPRRETEYAVSTLFSGKGALEIIDKTVSRRIERLPGFDGIVRINARIERICRESIPQLSGAATA